MVYFIKKKHFVGINIIKLMQLTVLFYACDLRLMYTKIQMITYQTDTLEQGNKLMFFSLTGMKMKLFIFKHASL